MILKYISNVCIYTFFVEKFIFVFKDQNRIEIPDLGYMSEYWYFYLKVSDKTILVFAETRIAHELMKNYEFGCLQMSVAQRG